MAHLGKILAALTAIFACLGFSAIPAQATSPAWWNSSWLMRAELQITTIDAIASGYSVSVTIPHSTYVSAGNALASGNDLRVVRWNGSAWTELDRLLDPDSSWNTSTTRIWFRTAAAISASSTDSSYWIYYANSSAGTPPASGDSIFDLYDDFSAGSVDLTKWGVLAPSGTTVASTGGELKLSGTTQAGSPYTPAGIYSNAGFTSGYATESRFRIVSQSATSQANWKANVGLDAGYLMINSQGSSTKRVQYYTTDWNDVGPSTLQSTTFGYQRVKESLTTGGVATHTENEIFQASRSGITPSSVSAPFLFSPDVAGGGETFDARFDDVIIRKFVANEPSVHLAGADGAEGKVAMSLTIDPALTFSVAGRNNNCNGLTNTIGANATPTAVPLGTLTLNTRNAGAQDLNVVTNAANGFSTYLRSTSATSPVLKTVSGPAHSVADTAAGAIPALGTEAFGFTTDDAGVGMTSGNVAPVPNASGSTAIMSASAPANRTSCVGYFVSPSGTSFAGSYQVTVVYTAIPAF